MAGGGAGAQRPSQKLASARLRVPVQADLQAVLVLLAATRFGLQDIQRLIPEEVYMNSPLYEEILERGRLKGLEEGKQEGIRSSLEQLLARKLGAPIPSRTKAKLQTLSDDQLTELLLLIGDAGSPAAVREVLKTALRSRS